MSRGKLALIVATELLLPVILAISLVFVIRSQPSKMPAASPLAQSLSPTLAGGEATDLPYPPSKQPIPVVVETPLPIPELIVLGATENPTPAYNPYPISNPNPTFTPYPTPTLRSGPASTLIPLIEPAKDAAGTIVYISQKVEQAAESEKELITISVDAAGMLIGRPSRLPIIPSPSGYFYPSPDGSHMVIISDMGEADVYSILDVNSGKVDPLIGGKSLEAFFGWYPDNQHVLVGPSRGLALWNIFNIKEYVLLAMPGYGDIGGAAASPDGQKVVYYSSNDFSSSAGVWMVNVDGREAHLLSESSPLGNFSWSPDGRYIVLQGGQMVMNADGSNLREVGNFHYHGYPRWSPDSRTLAIVISNSPEAIPYDEWNEDSTEKTNGQNWSKKHPPQKAEGLI